jgi:hypothetical protein
MIEEWKTIEGFEDYLISSKGRVKSFKRGKVKELKGSINRGGYLTYKVNNRSYGAQQLVAIVFLGHKTCGFELVIDHIDENPLNNCVSNLRIVTNRFNSRRNQKKYKSKYKGVCFQKQNNKWLSSIKISGIKKHLGYFNCEICAHLAYLKAVKKLETL